MTADTLLYIKCGEVLTLWQTYCVTGHCDLEHWPEDVGILKVVSWSWPTSIASLRSVGQRMLSLSMGQTLQPTH